MTKIAIGKRAIGPGHPCFVIAEAGVNHNGSLETAKKLIHAAKEAGADAVKFQTFSADRLVTKDAPKAEYQVRNTGSSESQYEMLKTLELSEEDHKLLLSFCKQEGILFLSTPFDEASADLLESLGVAAFKLPSGEITNLAFLSHVASKKNPIILSTGMSTLAEVAAAVQTIHKSGKPPLILLHCVSNYPADPKDVNLKAMATMQKEFGVPIGYSDHTLGTAVGIAAAALGACVIEKHLTLDRAMPGPDHKASLEPAEFKTLVEGIRLAEASLGHGRKEPAASEKNTSRVARKSLVAARRIPKGTVVSKELLTARRPGLGLSPAQIDAVLGKKAKRDIPAGALIAWEMLS